MLQREIGRLARRSLQVRELRNVLAHQIAHIQLALVLQHQDSGAGDGLGHGGDPEDGVFSKRRAAGRASDAHGSKMRHASAVGHERHRSRNLLGGDHLPHALRDALIERRSAKGNGQDQQQSKFHYR